MRLADLHGKRFGKLVAIGLVPLVKRTKWQCQCDCGKLTEVYAQNLVTGNTTTCGCSGRGPSSKLDLTGQKFGRLTVLSQDFSGTLSGGGTHWKCLCDCGRTVIRRGHSMRIGDVKTCGCGSHPLKYEDASRCAFNELLNQYKKNARKTQRVFSLTNDEFRFLTSSNCHYCGEPPSQLGCFRDRSKNSVRQPYLANGIDRVSNEIGYVLSNCVACCKRCNWMKATLSFEEFVGHLRKVLHHLDTLEP